MYYVIIFWVKNANFVEFLEFQLLSNYIDVADSLAGRLAVWAISALFVVQFGRSLRFCYLEFDKEALFDGKYRGTFPCF